ncbi:MAG: sulfatase/phosphatase domain-containing protein, partial [Bacteroidota bacterium]
ISRLDRDIGLIVDLLDSLGIAENTLLLLTSDNGAHDEGGVDEEQLNGSLDSPFNSTSGLRGFKRSLYEGGVRIPCIAYWPGTIAPGIDTSILYHPDIGPTLLDLTDAAALPNIDGRSFLPNLFGESNPVHEDIYWQFRQQQSLRKGNLKAYRGQNTSGNDRVELYDLSVDPAETNDLSGLPQYAAVLNTMKRRMNEENAGSACTFVPLITDTLPGLPPVKAKEKFNYPERGINDRGAAINGWAAPWQIITGFNHWVRAGGIQVPYPTGEIVTTSGNHLALDFSSTGRNVRLVRRLQERFPDDGSIYWLGYWSESSIQAVNNVFQVMLVATESFGVSGPNGQLLRIGKDFGRSDIGFVGGPYVTSSAEAPHFYVLRIATSGDASQETVHLFVDPPLTGEPSLATANVETTVNLNGGFDGIGIKAEGQPGVIGRIDDLYLGLDYSEIIPPDLKISTAISTPLRQEDLRLYPNPANDRFMLEMGRPAIITARLQDSSGRLVRYWAAELPHSFDISDIASGNYFLHVRENDGGEVTLPLVLSR